MRRYAPMKQSSGTRIPGKVRQAVLLRDRSCVGSKVGFPVSQHLGAIELDHVRASHGMGMKSETTEGNLVALCGACHRWKTENGRLARQLLLDYLARVDDPHAAHVDPCGLDCRVRVPPQ